jgi:threonine synthase
MLSTKIFSDTITERSFSWFSRLRCPECGTVHYPEVINTVCTNEDCRSTLFAVYKLPLGINPDLLLKDRPHNMWRYHEFLPVANPSNIVSLGEGFTPILPLTNLGNETGGHEVFWKDESGNPTGSFKARGISAAVSKAKELGISHIVTPTAGNAGGALAAYSARGGISAYVYMPKLTPKVFKDECRLYGATLVEVDGNIADCGKLAHQDALKNGWFEVSTLKEPYRLEGKKTMGYELAEQLNWELPDVIFYPTGGGTGLIGLWKAFSEMESLGWIGSERPRMVAVQSESCDGIVEAFIAGKQQSAFKDAGFTIANGLRVPKPYADKQILNVLRESSGHALTVSDKEMNSAVKQIAAKEGMLIAPEGAALWVAYLKLSRQGWIKPGQKVLLLNTGSGYKYLENIV